jgi:hypothetical protein
VEDGDEVDRPGGQSQLGAGRRRQRVVAGQDPGGGGRPAVRRCELEQTRRHVAGVAEAEEAGVDAVRGERLLNGLPGIGVAEPLPDEVGQEAGAEVVVTAVGDHDEPAVGVGSPDGLAEGQCRAGRDDPHGLPTELEGGLAGGLGSGSHPDHPVRVVLMAGLLDERARDGRGDRRAGGDVNRHSTRHSTTTF